MTTEANQRIGLARRLPAALVAILGAVVWTHALAGVFRSAAGVAVEAVAPAAALLTLAAVVTAASGVLFARRACVAAAGVGTVCAAATGLAYPAALVPALAIIPSGAIFASIGAWLAARLPQALDIRLTLRPGIAVAWAMLALVAVVQVGRLSTYMTNPDSDWHLSTRDPFYAKHECLNAYVYGAELDRRGAENVYDASHYPGLNQHANPVTELVGMQPEDPFQYAPQFLLWPRAAIAITHDYQAIRVVWFGINFTLCMAAVLLLSAWVAGRVGAISALLTPLILVAFPTLHNFQYGQFHFASVALAVLAMLAFTRRHLAVGGTLLAVSVLSKLFPALLLIALALERRWRELGWTAVAGTVITLATLSVTGSAPFIAFAHYHLPRLASGSAFAFGEAWPEVGELLIAGNQGIKGIFDKLAAMGVANAASWSSAAGKLYALGLVIAAAAVGLRRGASRTESAIAWVGLLGLGSLASTGAWADYVPVTCVWLLALLAPLTLGRPPLQLAFGLCVALQLFLPGTMPVGTLTGTTWMYPLSLLGALTMLVTFTVGVGVRTPAIAECQGSGEC